MLRIVVSTATLRCRHGSAPAPLFCTGFQQVEVSFQAAASIEDHIPGINIFPFGTCSITKQPCVPITVDPWTSESGLSLFGASALHEEAKLRCTIGGVIFIEEPGQHRVDFAQMQRLFLHGLSVLIQHTPPQLLDDLLDAGLVVGGGKGVVRETKPAAAKAEKATEKASGIAAGTAAAIACESAAAGPAALGGPIGEAAAALGCAGGGVLVGLGAEKLVYLTDIEGLRRVVDDPATLIRQTTPGELDALMIDGTIAGGMIPKVESCVHAVRGGVRRAHILDGRIPHVLLLEIFTDEGVGTQVLPGVPMKVRSHE